MKEEIKSERMPVEADKNSDFYYRLREKIENWLADKGKSKKTAEFIMLAPDMFYLLWKLSIDSGVSLQSRGILAAAVVYFISPLDLLPEAIFGPVGFLDDIALSAYVLNRIVNDTPLQLVKRYWAGKQDILMVIKNVLINADRLLGKGLWNRLRRKVL